MNKRLIAIMIVLLLVLGNVLVAGVSTVDAASKYFVNWTSGVDAAGYGLSSSRPFKSLNYAMANAACGSIIEIASRKTHLEHLVFNRPDCLANAVAIRVLGNGSIATGTATKFLGTSAVGYATDCSGYMFCVKTGNLTLYNIVIDGTIGSGQYENKLIYTVGSNVSRLDINQVVIKNARSECVRLRYNARNNVIQNSQFSNCGLDVLANSTFTNGESIYIGADRDRFGVDASNNNRIINNTFNLNVPTGSGSECIDIKENSSGNLVENNRCYYQRQATSGGINVNGTTNTLRGNTIVSNDGAGIRLGPPASAADPLDGTNNIVQNNIVQNNGLSAANTSAYGLKIMSAPQGSVCGTVFSGNVDGNVGGTGSSAYVTTADDPC